MSFRADIKLQAAVNVAAPFALEVVVELAADEPRRWVATVPALGVRVENCDADVAERDARAKALRQMADDMQGTGVLIGRKMTAAPLMAICFRTTYGER